MEYNIIFLCSKYITKLSTRKVVNTNYYSIFKHYDWIIPKHLSTNIIFILNDFFIFLFLKINFILKYNGNMVYLDYLEL